MLELAGLVVAGVSALGTLVQAYYSARSKNSTLGKSKIKLAESRAGQPLKIGAKRVAEVIDPELLSTLQKEIDICNQNLVRSFRSSDIDGEEREQLVEIARQQICDFLNQVKKFNSGQLPTKRLMNLWVSNRCVNE